MKTAGQIKRMMGKIEEVIEKLPPRSVFGDSNDGSIREMRKWLKELSKFYYCGMMPTDGDVRNWLYNDDGKTYSPLNDLED